MPRRRRREAHATIRLHEPADAQSYADEEMESEVVIPRAGHWRLRLTRVGARWVAELTPMDATGPSRDTGRP